MANEDTGWRPKGAMATYNGYEVWEYNVGPHQKNLGEVDGEIDLEDIETDEIVEE